ncbi:MAG: Crp/Fnr family transcriptional regulator [Carnobacterium sp.]
MRKEDTSAGHNQHHHSHSHKSCVSSVPIFNHLEEEQMNEITKTIHSVNYKKGETVYHAGEQSDSLFIVNKGKIRVYRLSESGKEQLVRILMPGDFTGELALFTETTYVSFAEAMAETSVCRIKRTDFQNLLLQYPTISLKVLTEFSKRLAQSEKQSMRFATEKVETRIALFLAECFDSENQTDTIELPMSKKDLASYLGTTPETISRKFTELEAQGLIEQKTHKLIKVLDLDGLLLN